MALPLLGRPTPRILKNPGGVFQKKKNFPPHKGNFFKKALYPQKRDGGPFPKRFNLPKKEVNPPKS